MFSPKLLHDSKALLEKWVLAKVTMTPVLPYMMYPAGSVGRGGDWVAVELATGAMPTHLPFLSSSLFFPPFPSFPSEVL